MDNARYIELLLEERSGLVARGDARAGDVDAELARCGYKPELEAAVPAEPVERAVPARARRSRRSRRA